MVAGSVSTHLPFHMNPTSFQGMCNHLSFPMPVLTLQPPPTFPSPFSLSDVVGVRNNVTLTLPKTDDDSHTTNSHEAKKSPTSAVHQKGSMSSSAVSHQADKSPVHDAHTDAKIDDVDPAPAQQVQQDDGSFPDGTKLVENSPAFHLGQAFDSPALFDTAVLQHSAVNKFDLRKRTCTVTRSNEGYNNTYYRYSCARSGKCRPKSKDKKRKRPQRTSFKCDCGYNISAAHPMKEDLSGRHEEKVVVTGLSLEHTNGCTGHDPEMQPLIQKRRGRKYSATALEYLKKEVLSGRYNTSDVKSWLVDQGFHDATLSEATNLRYRLMKGLAIRGWDYTKLSKKDLNELGSMEDYLYNEDLAKEISAGGQESVDALELVHSGLKEHSKGYDYRTTTDDQGRFSGTAWQSGRMRSRVRRHGRLIFIDDSRSNINTSGFCFWNVVVVDQDGKIGTGMGAMTMSNSDEAVKWIVQSLVSMCPEAAHVVEAMLSDFGETLDIAPSKTLLFHTFFSLTNTRSLLKFQASRKDQ